jgi:hypothetical protein
MVGAEVAENLCNDTYLYLDKAGHLAATNLPKIHSSRWQRAATVPEFGAIRCQSGANLVPSFWVFRCFFAQFRASGCALGVNTKKPAEADFMRVTE